MKGLLAEPLTHLDLLFDALGLVPLVDGRLAFAEPGAFHDLLCVCDLMEAYRSVKELRPSLEIVASTDDLCLLPTLGKET